MPLSKPWWIALMKRYKYDLHNISWPRTTFYIPTVDKFKEAINKVQLWEKVLAWKFPLSTTNSFDSLHSLYILLAKPLLNNGCIIKSSYCCPLNSCDCQFLFWILTPQPAFTFSKLIIETLEQSVKYIETYFTPCCSVSIVNFKKVNVSWLKAGTFLSLKPENKLLTKN